MVRGWYHAETDCDYPTTHKSVAYAESQDGGRTFSKPGYPGNQVITAPPSYTDPVQASEGDHRVIEVDDYLYMYFIAARDYQVRVARPRIEDGGRPGTWYKYYNGSFSQPGLGGEASPIARDILSRSWVSYNTYLGLFIGISYYPDGFGFAVSEDGIPNWRRLPGALVVRSEGQYWGRDAASKDLLEYPSIIGIDGDPQSVSSSFWICYMQLKPGEDFSAGRYLVRRPVHIRQTSDDLHSATPRVALTRYQRPSSPGASQPDTWVTVTSPGTGYSFVETLGYLYVTKPSANAIPLYDCYLSNERDHMVDINSDCGAPGNPAVRNLRQMGWISTVPFGNSRRVYRCLDRNTPDPGVPNHFVSADPACEGKETEWPIGYLAPFTFADALPGSPFYQYTSCLAFRDVEEGYACGGAGEPCDPGNSPYFRTGPRITRDHVAKFVAASAGFTEDPGPQFFEDILPSNSSYAWINRMARRGLLGGYPCGTLSSEPCNAPLNRPYYRPGNQATRGQIAKIVSNGAGYSEMPAGQTFEDVPSDQPFFVWIERLASRHIMGGYPCGGQGEHCGPTNRPYFRPGENASRGQVTKIASNTFFPNCSLTIRP